MHFTTLLTSSLALLTTTATALTINKARAAEPQNPSTSSSYPSYTLSYTSQYAGYVTLPSGADGTVSVTLQPGDVLINVAVNNPADNANCFVRDQWNGQLRAFGGPGQYVDAIEFVPADGKQARSIACVPA